MIIQIDLAILILWYLVLSEIEGQEITGNQVQVLGCAATVIVRVQGLGVRV